VRSNNQSDWQAERERREAENKRVSVSAAE
jgi:hypothetical protein